MTKFIVIAIISTIYKGMCLMLELPKRTEKVNMKIKHEYSYSEILTQKVRLDQVWQIVLSKEDLDLDMTKLIELLNNRFVEIWCMDY